MPAESARALKYMTRDLLYFGLSLIWLAIAAASFVFVMVH